jgi:hypothetical protein
MNMDLSVDVWLRGDIHATTHAVPGVAREPRAWTDADVTHLLVGMLRAMKRASDPGADPDQPIILRGFSWIVNPYDAGGVVVAIEMSLGAAVAGPFDVPERELNEKIQRVLDAERKGGGTAASGTVH